MCHCTFAARVCTKASLPRHHDDGSPLHLNDARIISEIIAWSHHGHSTIQQYQCKVEKGCRVQQTIYDGSRTCFDHLMYSRCSLTSYYHFCMPGLKMIRACASLLSLPFRRNPKAQTCSCGRSRLDVEIYPRKWLAQRDLVLLMNCPPPFYQ
jgi:hypothetical protein